MVRWRDSPALALDCPQAQSHNVRGALKETAQITAAQSGLAARGSAAIPSLIFQIRKNNPDSTDGEITNYLITAYCPVVNGRQELSEQQKRADLARFEPDPTATSVNPTPSSPDQLSSYFSAVQSRSNNVTHTQRIGLIVSVEFTAPIEGKKLASTT